MCSGGFAKCLGISLMPLAIVCVLCNILLFFPGGKSVDSQHITEQVWYFGGILGSGVLVSTLKFQHSVIAGKIKDAHCVISAAFIITEDTFLHSSDVFQI